MSTLSVQVPESLYSLTIQSASHDGVSLDQFVIDTLSEKFTALHTEQFIAGQRAAGDGLDICNPNIIVMPPDMRGDSHEHLAPYNVG